MNRTALRIVTTLLLTTLCAAGLLAADSYKRARGSYDYTIIDDYPLTDTNRAGGEEVSIKLFIPMVNKPAPLVIISHGLGGRNDGHDKMSKYLASHGYVVINPEHADSGLFKPDFSGERGSLGDFNAWKNRVADVIAIIDHLDTLEKNIPELKDAVNESLIAVGGHSFGAYTTQLISGLKITDPETGKIHDFSDKRPSAFIYLSAQGEDEELWISEDSWEKISRPVIVMTGTNDDGRNGEKARWRTEPYHGMPKGDKYLLWFRGAYHYTFSGKRTTLREPAQNPRLQAELFTYIKSGTLAFLDAYLLEDADAKQYLQKNRLWKDSGKKVVQRSK